jgi:hypothetical protein
MNIGEILEREDSIIEALEILNKRGTTHVIVKNKGDVEDFVSGFMIPLDKYIEELKEEFKILHKEVERYK